MSNRPGEARFSRREVLLFSAFLIGAAFYAQPREYDNTVSRFMLLGAMVDEGRLSIDSHEKDTVDKSLFAGHYYSNKAIGLPLLAAPVYWSLRKAAMAGPVMDDPAAMYLVRLWSVSLPFAALGLVLFRFLLAIGAPPRGALWSCVAYGFGTIALNHATIFSGHETAAFFLFSSFILLYGAGRQSPGGVGPSLGLRAGLCAGCAVLCDHVCIFGAAILLWYALSGPRGLKGKIAFFAGAALCAALLAWYDHVCFGSAFSLAYAHNDFPGFSRGASAGLFGFSWPKPAGLAGLLVSPSRGLLFISPILLYSLAGFAGLARKTGARRDLAVVALVPIVTVLAVAGFYAWDGGWTYGPRYLVPALPFLAVPLAFSADGSLLFFLLLALSVFQTACAQLGWPHAAPECLNPVAELMLPLMREGGTALSFLGLAEPGALAAGAVQCLVPAVLLAAAFRGLERRAGAAVSPRWRTAMGLWAACVATTVLFLRTPDQRRIHFHRGLLLKDAAWSLGSAELARASEREFALGAP